jgi:hypothetical protein
MQPRECNQDVLLACMVGEVVPETVLLLLRSSMYYAYDMPREVTVGIEQNGWIGIR